MGVWDHRQCVWAVCHLKEEVVPGALKCPEHPLQLVFRHKGGGGGGSLIEITKKIPPPARIWMQGRWSLWQRHRKNRKNHLWLMLGYERGGGGGRRVERTEKSYLWHIEILKRTTSGSGLETREVVVVADALKMPK
jgi:hypothetical protein